MKVSFWIELYTGLCVGVAVVVLVMLGLVFL